MPTPAVEGQPLLTPSPDNSPGHSQSHHDVEAPSGSVSVLHLAAAGSSTDGPDLPVRDGKGKQRWYDPAADEVDSEDDETPDPDSDEEVDSEEDLISEADSDLQSRHSDGDSVMDDGISLDINRAGCTDECREDFRQTCDTYQTQIDELKDKIRALNISLEEKTAEIQTLGARNNTQQDNNRNTEKTWDGLLRDHLNPPAGGSNLPYSKIYSLSCREENISPKTENVHPNLRLRRPTPREVQADILHNHRNGGNLSDDEADDEAEDKAEDEVEVVNSRPQSPSDELFVREDEHLGDFLPENSRQSRVSGQTITNVYFDRLPINIQANIIKFLFVQENNLIHCLSRLDPFVAPEDMQQITATRSGLLHRFHVSGTSCNVFYATKPDEHLKLLSLSRNWYFLAVHAFYGLNTFAFSSLGEFASFCAGIGKARRDRIQHVELLWIGSQFRVAHRRLEGKSWTYTSRRTWDVSWLCEMAQLKSLTIHINESGKSYMRRKYEPANIKEYMASKTAGQPNFRLMRQLRALQGLDYINQLRGMDTIRFFDFERHLKYGDRHEIRDWTFANDVKGTTTMPKPTEQLEATSLNNLVPVLTGFRATEEQLETVRRLYRTSCAFDADLQIRPDSQADPPLEEQQQEIQGEGLQRRIKSDNKTARPRGKRGAETSLVNQDSDDDTVTGNNDDEYGGDEYDGDGRNDISGSNDGDDGSSSRGVGGNNSVGSDTASTANGRSATVKTDRATTSCGTDDDDKSSSMGKNMSNPIKVDDDDPSGPTNRETSVASSNELFVRQSSCDTRTYAYRGPSTRSSREPSALSRVLSPDGSLFFLSYGTYSSSIAGASGLGAESSTVASSATGKRSFAQTETQPNPSQLSGISRPLPFAFNQHSTPRLNRLQSEEEADPFKRPRRK